MLKNCLLIINLLIIVVFCDNAVKEINDNLCVDSVKENIHLHLATKTPYRFIQNTVDDKIQYDDCKPIRMWSIIRHGSRTPSLKVINLMKTRLIDIRDQLIVKHSNGNLCEDDLKAFRQWKPTINENEPKFLVLEGTDELLELGERTQNRFPDLLTTAYNSSSYKFKFTETQRTRLSFEGFASGLFGRNILNNIYYEEPLTRDPILRFYKLCPRWKKEVNKNPDAIHEVLLWSEGEEMQNVLKSFQLRSGIEDLSIEDVRLIYTTCAFETAIYKYEKSPWCSLLNEHNVKVLEFLEDLEYYWVDGYGYDLTYKQACPAIMDMYKHIIPTSQEPNSTFYFTHSGTMLKMLAHLGLYKDEFRLTHKDFDKDRKWIASKIDPFGSNLMFIAFNCKHNENYILTMHQERIVHIPGCPPDNDLCHLDVFTNILNDSINNCKFNEICMITET